MTGITIFKRGIPPHALALVSVLTLAACDENGEFAFPSGDSAVGASSSDAPPRRTITTDTANDVERPDLFDVTDRGLWDGRPSLGGVWVAHPDVAEPERVIIRNPENGRSVVGALFRRERENPGPLLQVSSDAAEELGVLAGAPTELSVIALRRDETEPEAEAAPEENPVVASLAAPVSVESAPLDPVADAASAAIDTAETGAEAALAVVLPPASAAAEAPAEAVADAPIDVSAVLADVPPVTGAGEADLTGPQFQIGVFSVEANANDSAQRLRNAGIPASVVVQQAGGRDVWRLMAAPADAEADMDATLAQIQGLGFADAFLVEDTAAQEG